MDPPVGDAGPVGQPVPAPYRSPRSGPAPGSRYRVGIILRSLSRLIRFVAIMAASVATIAGAIVFIAPHVNSFVGAHVSEHEQLNLDKLSERSIIYDRYGNRMATLYFDQNRVAVPIEDVPETVIGSILAAEDDDFYDHKGVNVKSVVRAFGANIESGAVEQGGSTITQQLVKQAITGDDQSFQRKIREAVLAVELEKQMTKTEILERYVNTVYFGNGAYGVQAAAEIYFDKDVKDLDWADGALLAALIRSPNRYDPVDDPELAFARRGLVLRRLVETDRIDQKTADVANYKPLPSELSLPTRPNDYFVNKVKRELERDPRIGSEALLTGGLRVYTTFDPFADHYAKEARNQTMPGGKPDGTFDLPPDPETGEAVYGTAAIASVEPSSGAVRVLIGGPEFTDERAGGKVDLTSKNGDFIGFQPGSAFKTFVLAAAMEEGHAPNDLVDGRGPCPDIPGYEKVEEPPENFDKKRGAIATLTEQTQVSSNCGFLRLGAIVGLQKVVDIAKKMGITTPIDKDPTTGRPDLPASLPIGTKEVYPLDMAVAYSVLANDGILNRPYFIDRVEDKDGNIIRQHQAQGERVMSAQSARLVTQILASNVEEGTGTRAQVANGQPAAGKTGTTQEAYAIWFVGYTPHLSTAIWMGSPTGQVPLGFGGATGGRFPAATFGQLYSKLLEGEPVLNFRQPFPVVGGTYLRMQDPFDAFTNQAPNGTRRPRSRVTQPPPPTGPPVSFPPSPGQSPNPSGRP